MKAILLNTENEDEKDDDDLSSLAAINQAMRSVGLRDIHLNQGQQHNGDGNEEVSSKRRRGNNYSKLAIVTKFIVVYQVVIK